MESSHNEVALFTVSFIALAANVAVAVYQVKTIRARKLNPLRDELYTHLPQYQQVVEESGGRPVTEERPVAEERLVAAH